MHIQEIIKEKIKATNHRIDDLEHEEGKGESLAFFVCLFT